MTWSLIRSILETRVDTWSKTLSPVLPIEFLNSKFVKPANGSRWARCSLIYSDSPMSRYLDGSDRVYSGVLAINFFTPRDRGSAEAEALLESLGDYFPYNATFSSGGILVRMVSPLSGGNHRPDEIYLHTPASIRFRAE